MLLAWRRQQWQLGGCSEREGCLQIARYIDVVTTNDHTAQHRRYSGTYIIDSWLFFTNVRKRKYSMFTKELVVRVLLIQPW